MVKLLQSGWVTMVLGTALYFVLTAFLLLSATFSVKKAAAHPETEEPKSSASWDFVNPEVDRLVGELKKEKAALAVREQQLNELATRLQAERSEINQVTQAVHQLRKEFDDRILRVREEEPAKLKKLAKMYATMSPEGASTIFKQMPDEQVVKIFVFMKDADTAAILESFAKLGADEAKRAALISDHLRTISRGPAPKP